MNKYNKYSKDAVDVREFINKINKTAQILKEAYVYEDDVEIGTDPRMSDENTVEPQMDNNGTEFVDAIRKAALQGIQAFADNVDSESYIFFKKVFIMADKVLSEKEDGSGSDE